MIALVDYEKCFDRIEYESTRGAFTYFRFGHKYINTMFLLFTELEMCTISNGFTSDFLDKKRGVNQGCNVSPLVYTICGEIIMHLIKQNSNIKGIALYGLEHILSQFADDTAAYLSYDRETLEAFVNTLQIIESAMGLKVSYEKTTLYRVGSGQYSSQYIYHQGIQLV